MSGYYEPTHGIDTRTIVTPDYFQGRCPNCLTFFIVTKEPYHVWEDQPLRRPDPYVVKCTECGTELAVMDEGEG